MMSEEILTEVEVRLKAKIEAEKLFDFLDSQYGERRFEFIRMSTLALIENCKLAIHTKQPIEVRPPPQLAPEEVVIPKGARLQKKLPPKVDQVKKPHDV